MAIGILRPVFRYCAAIAGALLLAFLLADMVLPDAASMGLEGALIFALFMLIGGLVGWLAAEMLVQKSFRVFHMGRKWFGFERSGCCSAPCSSAVSWTSRATKTPAGTGRGPLRQRGRLRRLHGAGRAGEHRGGPRAARERHRGRTPTRAPPGPARARLRHCLLRDREHGDKLQPAEPPALLRARRRQAAAETLLYQPQPKDAELLETVSNSVEGIPLPEAAGHRASASTVSYASVSWVNAQGEPESLELSGAEAAELYWNCILPDMQDGNIGLVWYAGAGAENSEVYDCRVSMELVKEAARRARITAISTLTPPSASERTNAWLLSAACS